MKEKVNSSFICFNEGATDGNGGAARMIVNLENMDLTNENIAGVREILRDAAEKMRNLLGL